MRVGLQVRRQYALGRIQWGSRRATGRRRGVLCAMTLPAPARGLRMPHIGRHSESGWQSGGGKPTVGRAPPEPPGPCPLAAWRGGAFGAPGGGAALASRGGPAGPPGNLTPGSPPSLAGPRKLSAAGDGDHSECQSDCGLGPRSEPVSISTRELTIPINKLGSCQEWPGAQCHKRSLLRPPGHPEVTERTKLG